MRARRFLVWLLAAIALAASAAAQHAFLGDPEPRALHRRLLQADAVALGSIATLETGRIHVKDVRAAVGSPPERIELKRAPSRPPDLAAGERVVLLLRGARSPYLLVGGPGETVRLGPDADESAWATVLLALHRALADGDPVAPVYAHWLDDADPSGRRELARGLADPDLDVSALAPRVFHRLADLATDGRDPEAARAAVRHPQGTRRLLERLLARGSGEDPRVLAVALEAAPPGHSALGEQLLEQSLRHEDASMRAAALRASGTFAPSRSLRARLVQVAADDPDPALRELARRRMRATAVAPSAANGVGRP